MKTFVIIFVIFSATVAIANLVYVAVDVIRERLPRRRDNKDGNDLYEEMILDDPIPEPIPEPIVEIEPIPEPIPEPEPIIETVETVSAEEADALLDDFTAERAVHTEAGGKRGKRVFINIGRVSGEFSAGDEVDIEALRERGLIPKKADSLKILADGILDKPLTVRAEAFSLAAIKMIELTGGTVIILN